jgi:hypothetical protein
MAIYHPALDPYHSSFRILHILAYKPAREYDPKVIRILDFYAVFPHLISTIRLPNEYRSKKKQFLKLKNPYWFTGEPVLVFTRMEPLQQTALNLLYAQGLADPQKYTEGQIKIVVSEFQKMKIPQPSSMFLEVLEFLVNGLGSLPFHGLGGLKARTGLLEYRYDAV